MEDKSQTNQGQTASMNRTKAPQKVEVVVANSSSGSEAVSYTHLRAHET